MGDAVPAVSRAGRPEAPQQGPVLPRGLRQGARAAAARHQGPRHDHDPRGHRRRRPLRRPQDVPRRAQHRHGVRPRPRRRLRAQSALPALLRRPRRGRRSRRRPRGAARGLRARGHAFGRQQPALGPRRLAVRGPGQHRHRRGPQARRGAGHEVRGPEHLAVSPRVAAVRDLRRGRRQRLRRGDGRRRTDLLGPQRRQHPRLPLHAGRLPAEGLRQARRTEQPLRLRLLPDDGARRLRTVHAHLRGLRERRPAGPVSGPAVRLQSAPQPRDHQSAGAGREHVPHARRGLRHPVGRRMVSAGGHQGGPRRQPVRRRLVRRPTRPHRQLPGGHRPRPGADLPDPQPGREARLAAGGHRRRRPAGGAGSGRRPSTRSPTRRVRGSTRRSTGG